MTVIPWPDKRCIACGQARPLTVEHVIPESIGGILCCKFLCKDCNSRFGHSFEAKAKSDPAVRIAIGHLKGRLPALYDFIENGQAYQADVGPAVLRATLRDDKILGTQRRLKDGSVVAPEPDTPDILRQMLLRDGYNNEFIAQALQRLEAAPPNVAVEISDEIVVKKWHARSVKPLYDGPDVSPLVLLKIAYEFAALLLGPDIFADSPALIEIRTSLLSADEEFAKLLVERRIAPKYGPLHGICFHGNDPHATIEIRLFRKLAYHVRLPNISLQIDRVVYTHDLTTNDHWREFSGH